MALTAVGLLLAACGSSSGSAPSAPSAPKETVSATGAPQCSVTYHSTSSGTALSISTTVAGKLDVSVAAVGAADEQTVTAAQPGLVHLEVRETALETLAVTLATSSGTTYHCSVTPR